MMKAFCNFLLVLFSISTIISGSYLIHEYYSRNQEEKRIEGIAERKQQEYSEEQDVKQQDDNQKIKEKQNENIQNPEKDIQPQKKVLQEYEKLYNENSDLIGWIKIDNTVINYPVMQNNKNSLYYEHRDWDGNKSDLGLPLVLSQNSIDNDKHIMIFAHNMRNGTMFGSLKKYKNKSYYNKHKIIKFDTLYEKRKYKIISVFLTKAYYNSNKKNNKFIFYNYLDLSPEEQFNKYVKYAKEHSIIKINESVKFGEELITLCTCHYHTKNGRLLIVAKKIS